MKQSPHPKNKTRRLVPLLCFGALAVLFLWIAQVVRPECTVYLLPFDPVTAAGETIEPRAIERRIVEHLQILDDSAALRLVSLARSARPGTTQEETFPPGYFSPDECGCKKKNANLFTGRLDRWVRKIAGKIDINLKITVEENDPLTVRYEADMEENSVFSGIQTGSGEQTATITDRAAAHIASEIGKRVSPVAALLQSYDLSAPDAFAENLYRARLYETLENAEPELGSFSGRSSGDKKARINSALGIVCESFGYGLQDTAALNKAARFYREAAKYDPKIGDVLDERIAAIEDFTAKYRTGHNDDVFIARFLSDRTKLPDSCRQLILVYNDRPERVLCVFRRYEKQSDGHWHETASPIHSNVGRNGIAPFREKREGDGRTPSGAYPMGFAFGYQDDIPSLKWPFLTVTKQHFWISDPEDPLYNQMTMETPKTDNFEYLRRDDHVYKYAAVVEYNMRPVEKYMGSAIFFHIESGFNRGSAGCITVSENKTVEVLQWLDPEKSPYMITETLPNNERTAF